MASNLSFGSGVSVIVLFTGSPDHVSTLSGPGTRPVSGQLYETTGGGAGHHVPVSCCLSAAGIRFSVIRCPLGDWAFLTVGLPGDKARTPTGLSRSTHTRYDRGGCLLYPGDGGAHPADRKSPAAACRFPAASPYTPLPHPISGALITRHQRGFTQFTRPVFPLPVAPGWNRSPWAFPRASHPAVTGDACRGGDRPLSTSLKLRLGHRPNPSLHVHW